ncbi:Oidioi.mRNA.OKI2018_I69.XSR.g16732.t1.cds [Oikopleura dioica]|uniref:Oidioi.mRNA.OKI2018_I69.XSR.g16732.t1.cds n=1 Tax=Oikopleura dioica TaxID=34765 RepID=A0ABN7SH31_OIKDI|nr:Oidioi.mRNA.OKI2018_I69.XSR.g16732.t1.cds [Oikopleura dioica]
MLLAMDELLPNISLDAQDDLGNTALHYHVTAKGAFAVEACLKLLQAGADFRLKNKNGQEPLELLESNEKLSTKQLDQVKCEIWARMDRKEQTQELQKSLEDVEAENSEPEPEPPKRRASIFDDLPKTILKDTVEIFNDEPLSKKLGDKEEYSDSEGEGEEEEEEPLSDSCLDSEPELVDIDSEPEQLESSFESRKNENEESEEIVPEVFVSECASPVSEMAQTESVPSQLPAPVFLKEEQFSFSSSLKDSISGSFESIPINSEDEESPSPEPSPKQMPKIYSQAYCCPSGVKKGQVISKFKQLSLCNPENWIGGNKSDVMKWVKSKDGRSLHLQDRQLIKSATSRWNKIYKISV